MNKQMKSKHVLFKSRYIRREYTPLGIHGSESAAPSKRIRLKDNTNRSPLFCHEKIKANQITQMQVKSTVATHHSRQRKSMPIQLTKKEKNYPACRRSLTPVSHMGARAH